MLYSKKICSSVLIAVSLLVFVTSIPIQPGNQCKGGNCECSDLLVTDSAQNSYCIHNLTASCASSSGKCPKNCCSNLNNMLKEEYCLPEFYCSSKSDGSECSADLECSSKVCCDGTCKSSQTDCLKREGLVCTSDSECKSNNCYKNYCMPEN
jgi:hypothetical protein